MYYVYAIYNSDHAKLYIGQCQDIEERLMLHNCRKFPKSYTARFSGEWKLVYSEKCDTRVDALKRERQLKSYQGRQFVKSTIIQR